MSQTPADPNEEDAAEPDAPLFFWYFFPLARNIAAWEATTGSGRATCFFHADSPVAAAVPPPTPGPPPVNLPPEPPPPRRVFSPPTRFQRYAIGARKLPDLRALRAACLGRAIHSSLETWQTQVLSITGKP